MEIYNSKLTEHAATQYACMIARLESELENVLCTKITSDSLKAFTQLQKHLEDISGTINVLLDYADDGESFSVFDTMVQNITSLKIRVGELKVKMYAGRLISQLDELEVLINSVKGE